MTLDVAYLFLRVSPSAVPQQRRARPPVSGKELVLAKAFLHPETERQATEVGRYGSGVWFERRSLAWFQVPCAEQWLTVGETQLIPFGRVSSIAAAWPLLAAQKASNQ